MKMISFDRRVGLKKEEDRRRNAVSPLKGISTLIAAVLLIAVTLLISLIVSTSFTTLAKTQTSTVQTRTTEAVNCTSSDMSIEAVYITIGRNNISQVVVRNSGQIRENIVGAQIINKTGGTGTILSSLPIAVPKGDIVTFLFNISGTNSASVANSTVPNVSCSNFDRAIITTECTVVTYSRTPTNC